MGLTFVLFCIALVTGACGGDEFEGCEISRTCPSSNGGSGGGGGSEGVGGAAGDSGSAAGAAGEGGGTGESGGSSGVGGSGSGGSSGMGGGPVEPEPCDGECEADECCDGECVDLESDLAHCGACGDACEPSRADSECVAGECVITACVDGFLDCNGMADDGCEVLDAGVPEAPTPLGPMLGSYTGSLHARDVIDSLRPTFVWAEVESLGCGVAYHLQVEDECPISSYQECEFPTPEVDRTGVDTPEFALTEDLPVEESVEPLGRRYFWRVRSCDALERCSGWSEVRYLDVGRVREDIDGDGYADIVAIADRGLHLFLGKPDFGEDLVDEENVAAAAATLALGRISEEAPSLRFLGDVNGDGFGDVGFSAGIPPDNNPPAYGYTIYLGGSDIHPDSLLEFYLGDDGYGFVHPAGDFDHDGFADFLLSLSNPPAGSPRVAFFHGSADFDATAEPVYLWEGVGKAEPEAWLGSAGSMGDFNADGYPDIAIGDGADQARLILGQSPPDLEQYMTWSFEEVVPECHPGSMTSLDMNGDAFDDLAFLCGAADIVSARFGGAVLEEAPAWGGTLSVAAEHVASGDIDADGYDDLLTSGPYVFLGGESPAVTALAAFDLATGESFHAVALADHDGDGLLDAIVNDTWFRGDAALQPDFTSRLGSIVSPVFVPMALGR